MSPFWTLLDRLKVLEVQKTMSRSPETENGSFVIDVTVDYKDLLDAPLRGDQYSHAFAISAKTYLLPCNEAERRTSPASDKRLSVLYNIHETYSDSMPYICPY